MSALKKAAVFAALLVGFLLFVRTPQAEEQRDYGFTHAGPVSPDRLAEEIRQATGVKLVGRDQDGYFEVTHGEETAVRIVMLHRALSPEEAAKIAAVIDEHRGEAPTGEPKSSRARNEEFRARYAQARSDSERLRIVAEYLGLAADR